MIEPANTFDRSEIVERSDRQLLEEFVVDNEALEMLEAHISAFNIFEAVGMTGQEIRHSYFLAFLLDPSQNHGLRDGFLKRFLSMAIRNSPEKQSPVSLIDIDVSDFDDAEVLREQDRIDITIRIPSRRTIVIIENKVYSGEHSDQLNRYLLLSRNLYPDWKIVPIYLTLSGTEASEIAYFQLSYVQIADLIEETARRTQTTTGQEINALLKHYVQMLRRHHLADAEIDELCARIYRRHKRALDLIFEKRPDRQSAIYTIIENVLSETDGIELPKVTGKINKRYYGFYLADWKAMPLLFAKGIWSDSDCGLMFIFSNEPYKLELRLQITPVKDELRQKIWDWSQRNTAIFPKKKKLVPANWQAIYCRTFLDSNQIMSESLDEVVEHFRESLRLFFKGDLIKIKEAIQSEFPHVDSIESNLLP